MEKLIQKKISSAREITLPKLTAVHAREIARRDCQDCFARIYEL